MGVMVTWAGKTARREEGDGEAGGWRRETGNRKQEAERDYSSLQLFCNCGKRDIQELLGHKGFKIAEIYTYVIRLDIKQISSPLDRW